jgi:hypothetical protein
MKTSVVRINETKKDRKLIQVMTPTKKTQTQERGMENKGRKNLSVLIRCLCRNIQSVMN